MNTTKSIILVMDSEELDLMSIKTLLTLARANHEADVHLVSIDELNALVLAEGYGSQDEYELEQDIIERLEL